MLKEVFQLVDESLKKNVVIKNKQAGWAGLLRSPLLSLSRGSRQVITVVSCPVSSYLWDHVIALFIKSGAVLYSATLSFHLTILILVSLAWWRLAATAVATSHTTSQWQTFCDIVTVQIDSCATTTVELIIYYTRLFRRLFLVFGSSQLYTEALPCREVLIRKLVPSPAFPFCPKKAKWLLVWLGVLWNF